MAGAGYKLFNTGDVLTAAQVNTYLQEQTVMVFASSTARTTALSGVLAEGMVSYLQDTNAVEVYNGSAWVGVSGAGDITEVQAGVGISIASGTGPIPVITNSSTDLITTAGDLLYGTAADTVARLGIGTAGQVLKVNSGATAPEWATSASGGGLTLLSTTTLSGASTTVSSISGSYKNLILVLKNVSASDSVHFRLNADTGNNYYSAQIRQTGTTLTSEQYNPGDKYRFDREQNAGATNLTQSVIRLYRYTDTDVVYIEANTYSGLTASSNRNFMMSTGIYDNSAAVDSVTILPASGTITGTLYIYGES